MEAEFPIEDLIRENKGHALSSDPDVLHGYKLCVDFIENQLVVMQELISREGSHVDVRGISSVLGVTGLSKSDLSCLRDILVSVRDIVDGIFVGAFHDKSDVDFITTGLFTLFPFVVFSVFLIFMFRISYKNYLSAKSQLLQIDLRRSLCRFIDSYAAFCNQLPESNNFSLKAFESVVFSNISEGSNSNGVDVAEMESIVKLINAFRSST